MVANHVTGYGPIFFGIALPFVMTQVSLSRLRA
jgi:hypothetical protein